MSRAGLSVAARRRCVVLRSSPCRRGTGGTFALSSAEQTRERVALVRRIRSEAGGRPYGSDALLQVVARGRDPTDAARELVADPPDLDVENVLVSPFVLLARTAEEAAAELVRRHETYGSDSFTTHQPSLEPMAKVIAALEPPPDHGGRSRPLG